MGETGESNKKPEGVIGPVEGDRVPVARPSQAGEQTTSTANPKATPSAVFTALPSPSDSSSMWSRTESFLIEPNAGPRHIPKVVFIEDVPAFIKAHTLEHPLMFLQGLLSKFQFMELSLTAQRKTVMNKIPEAKEALEAIQLLQRKKEAFRARFVLADQIYAAAEIEPTDTVFLWLGANVLLEYPLGEAQTLLENNKATAEAAAAELTAALEFLRKQQTTTEINLSMVHNYGVQQRKLLQQQSEGAISPNLVNAEG